MAEDPGQGAGLERLEVGWRESVALVELAGMASRTALVGSGTAGHCTIETLDFGITNTRSILPDARAGPDCPTAGASRAVA